MTGNIDLSLIDWSRAQFALTAMYHWLFVPLTLGLAFIIAIMETQYVRTGKQQWKNITKFWMTLFGINFVIGVATGIILEFEFGTNWSNYSWFVGDIFGAPLAIEGIMAFFLESTFIAVMFFGWNKVSKKFHLFSTWMVFAGAKPFSIMDFGCQRLDAVSYGYALQSRYSPQRNDQFLAGAVFAGSHE